MKKKTVAASNISRLVMLDRFQFREVLIEAVHLRVQSVHLCQQRGEGAIEPQHDRGQHAQIVARAVLVGDHAFKLSRDEGQTDGFLGHLPYSFR